MAKTGFSRAHPKVLRLQESVTGCLVGVALDIAVVVPMCSEAMKSAGQLLNKDFPLPWLNLHRPSSGGETAFPGAVNEPSVWLSKVIHHASS